MKKREFVSPTIEVVGLSHPVFVNVSGGDTGIHGGDTGSSGNARSEKFFGYSWEDNCVGQEEY